MLVGLFPAELPEVVFVERYIIEVYAKQFTVVRDIFHDNLEDAKVVSSRAQ